ncbi:MAG: hypothetical protein E6J38_01180 [Chloroflexi bacterium]|nr:MAG: hypothetical protein E6J38_01180 [Chloroflexota bacterium]
MNEKTIAVREAADDQDPGGTLARRTLLGAIGLATIGGLTAGVLGLPMRSLPRRSRRTPITTPRRRRR